MEQREKTQLVIITGLAYLLINIVAHFTVVPLKVLFMDDISLFNQLHDINMAQYLLTGHDNKIRPVSDFFIYLGYEIFKNNTEHVYIYMLIVGTASCITLYLLTYHVVKNVYIPCLVCLVFSASRFAYYTVGQYFGVMESVCVVMAVILLYWGIKYYDEIDPANEKKCFINTNLALLFLVFSHERYITMYAFVFMLVFIKNKISKIALKRYALVILNFCFLWLFRIAYLGSDSFQGTGSTSLLSTLSINNILGFFFEGIFLILGWNAGEEYLNGITINCVNTIHNLIPFLSTIFVIFTFFGALKKTVNKKRVIEMNAIFLSFIIFSLLSGCITIRLELRWIYVPYAIYLLLVAFNVNEILKDQSLVNKNVIVLAALSIVAITIFNESYYRKYWKNNYLGHDYKKYNTIYDLTVGKYGPEYLAGKTIYIIEDKEMCEVVNHDTLKSIFMYYCGKDMVNIAYINSLEELIDDNDEIVLYAEQYSNDIWEKSFYNITNLLGSANFINQ